MILSGRKTSAGSSNLFAYGYTGLAPIAESLSFFPSNGNNRITRLFLRAVVQETMAVDKKQLRRLTRMSLRFLKSREKLQTSEDDRKDVRHNAREYKPATKSIGADIASFRPDVQE